MAATLLFGSISSPLLADSRYAGRGEFSEYAEKLRENALLSVEPQVLVPTTSRERFSRFPWRRNIVTTTFWVGELPTPNNPTPNTASSWDPAWKSSYGGYDNPDPNARRGFLPAAFTPRQNPFYVALPYNDVMRGGRHTPEASRVVPWFRERYVKPGHTTLKGQWIAIRHKNKVAYAQWEDCGPFRTDHWQYVFGRERPSPNLNKGAGLDVSPAVRDFLGMAGTDVTDWKFVDFKEVPRGPWATHGNNNTFIITRNMKNGTYVELECGRHTIRVRK